MSLHHISDEPAGLFSGPFREETEKGIGRQGTTHVLVAFDLYTPGAVALDTSKKYSNVALHSVAGGQYEQKIRTFGKVPRSVFEQDNTLNTVEVVVVLNDQDRDFAREVASYRGSIRGSRALIRLLSPNVSDGDAFTGFDGVLDAYEQIEPMVWALRLRPDDGPLQLGKVPKTPLTQTDWAAIHADAVGQYLGPLYGIHDSNGTGESGSVPALYVDTVNFRYAWMLGAGTVTNAYSAGTLVATSDYTASTVTINGKLWSIVTFDADQGDNAITLDVEGLTDNHAGGGTLITNPVEQLRHFLVNFVWNDWRSGAYYAESTAPLATQYFNQTADFLNALGHEGSKRYAGTEQIKALDALNEWLDSHEIKAFWTNNGKLAIRPIDHRSVRVYFATQWLRGDETALSFKHTFDPSNIVRHVSAQYIYNEAQAKYMQTLEVADLSVADDVTVSRTLPWSAARVL